MDDKVAISGGTPQRIPPMLLRVLQWSMFAIAALLALTTLIPLQKIGVPGVNPTYVYATVIFCTVIAIIHLPYAFWRIPKGLRVGAYAALIGSFVATVATSTIVREAYERTPEGAKEAALQARDAKELAETHSPTVDADPEFAELEAAVLEMEAAANGEGPTDTSLCLELVPSIIDMSKEQNGPEIFEINSIDIRSSTGSSTQCRGMATTNRAAR